jgi:hypothetical protein
MNRTCQITTVVCLVILIAGCPGSNGKPPLNHITLGQLGDGSNGQVELLKTVNFEMQVFEIPADNLKDFDEVRRTLDTQPLKYTNQISFSANSFSAYYGRIQSLATLNDLLTAAEAHKLTSMSLMMNEGQEPTINIVTLDFPQVVFFTSEAGKKEGARIGPGILGLRLKAEKTESADNSCAVTLIPVFAIPTGNAIPELNAQMKKREFPFPSASFGLNMRVGDFIVLAPEEDTASQPDYLASLIFNNPGGSLFFSPDKRKPPQLKPAVRIYILICNWIDIY